MTTISLRDTLQNLPGNASEAVIDLHFSPQLLEALGFQPQEIRPQYPTGEGQSVVDKAARKTVEDDVFLHTRSNPDLLLELKGREFNLSSNTAPYKRAIHQLKRYLLAPNCKTARWGIITNSCHIQLFRKHGKVVYPATECLALNGDNIDEIVSAIRTKIENPTRALTIAVYNNKGGVGKTTTTVNLAAMLTDLGKKVLAIDFDPNQQDLTSSLGLPLSEGAVFDFLDKRDIKLESVLQFYNFLPRRSYQFLPRRTNSELTFDVIPADKKLEDASDNKLREKFRRNMLHRKLESARQEYDYILIDSPPNWRFFSQLAVYASDVILIPTKHNSFASLKNAAMAIKTFFPEIRQEKADGSPIPLPIFFNGEKITTPQLVAAHKEIDSIIEIARQEGFDLASYFYPRDTAARRDFHIPAVPSYASISGAAFSRTPAVYQNRAAHDYYKNLAKEYFLQ